MICQYCGSSKHHDTKCSIKQKADLMVLGVPAEHLFDYVVEVETAEGLPRVVEVIRKEAT